MDPGRRVAHVAPEHGLERGRQGRALEEVGAVGLDGVDARGEGVDPVGDGEVDRLGAQLLGSLDEPGRARVRETARLDGVVVVLTPGVRSRMGGRSSGPSSRSARSPHPLLGDVTLTGGLVGVVVGLGVLAADERRPGRSADPERRLVGVETDMLADLAVAERPGREPLDGGARILS